MNIEETRELKIGITEQPTKALLEWARHIAYKNWMRWKTDSEDEIAAFKLCLIIEELGVRVKAVK